MPQQLVGALVDVARHDGVALRLVDRIAAACRRPRLALVTGAALDIGDVTCRDDLARRGQQREQAEQGGVDAAAAAKQRALDAKNATSRDLAALHLSPIRWLWRGSIALATLVVAMAVLAGGTCGLSLALAKGLSATDRHLYPLGIAASVAGAVVFVALTFVVKAVAVSAGRVRYAETERWLASLPFAVTGYLEVIGRRRWLYEAGTFRDPSGMLTDERDLYADVKVELHGFHGAPPHELMGQLLDGLGAPFSHATLLAPETMRPVAFSFRGGESGYVVAPRLRIVVEQLLVPLHARFPMDSAKVFVDGTRDAT